MASLQDFMISRVRVKLLKQFLSNPGEMYYVRQLTRKTDEEINAVRRELERMSQNGMVKSEKRGNRLYYHFKPSYPFYQELLSLVAKTSGLGADIRKNQNKLGKLKFVMLSGRFIRGKQKDPQDVDMLIVGEVIMPQLQVIVQKHEAQQGVDINYTVMTQDEFNYRKQRRDPFILSILQESRVMIIGDEHQLVSQ